jgi:hypothetical protein
MNLRSTTEINPSLQVDVMSIMTSKLRDQPGQIEIPTIISSNPLWGHWVTKMLNYSNPKQLNLMAIKSQGLTNRTVDSPGLCTPQKMASNMIHLTLMLKGTLP